MDITSTFSSRRDELRARHDALAAAEPKLRARDRAMRLGVSEAELVAAECGGLSVMPLAGAPKDIFQELGSLGEVMALSRNDACVHERHGRYEDIQLGHGHVGLVLGPDIDLRVFFDSWRTTFAVTENGRRSLQFFDRHGMAVHKVYVTDATDAAAYDALVARFATSAPAWPDVEPVVAAVNVEQSNDVTRNVDNVNDPQGLRAAWQSLKDTHDFFPMLRKFKATRLGALRAAGTDLAQQVPLDTAETVLTRAAESGLPVMVFVSNKGIVQIHTGPVHKLLRTGPWFNVLDPRFNLHLNTTAITSTWVVNKPTVDGWVTSVEVYAATGDLIVQMFGARKPGNPELPAWRKLLVGLCSNPLAS
ncbi:hemin-degrading factor [Pigmentiphaga litoralis]|uniref:hemin-degrading factor n=1 Tax=Pigmentiphaga litoralis TaxID=516702 RepID=UPI001992CCFC|nr:hemin-degrading factor [Pigmentiphaga litoralis]